MPPPAAALRASPSPLPFSVACLAGGTVVGRLDAITIRPGPREAPRPMRTAVAEAGRGLAGDRHADALSPRQVLVAGTPAYTRHGLAPHTLRENLLLDIDTAHLASGTLLRVGMQTVLRLTFACEACGYLDARAPGLAARIGRSRGMLARVVAGGPIEAGDPILQLPAEPGGSMPAWSDDWRERVAAILARVPPGMAVDYRQLARLAGVQPVYCRTFPRLARNLGFAHAAVAMYGRPEVPRWEGGELFDPAVR